VDHRKRNAITVRAAVENLMLFSLYITFVRSCSTPTNHSHEPALIDEQPAWLPYETLKAKL